MEQSINENGKENLELTSENTITSLRETWGKTSHSDNLFLKNYEKKVHERETLI